MMEPWMWWFSLFLVVVVAFGFAAASLEDRANAACAQRSCTGSARPRRMIVRTHHLYASKGIVSAWNDYECLCVEVPQ